MHQYLQGQLVHKIHGHRSSSVKKGRTECQACTDMARGRSFPTALPFFHTRLSDGFQNSLGGRRAREGMKLHTKHVPQDPHGDHQFVVWGRQSQFTWLGSKAIVSAWLAMGAHTLLSKTPTKDAGNGRL